MTTTTTFLSDFTLETQSQKVGQKLGESNWITVTQPMITQFSEVTLDPDPMHIDPQWCKTNSPFGSTIAFGFLSLSLLTSMLHDIDNFKMEDHEKYGGYWINYGFNRIRLPSPVPVDSRIRMHTSLVAVTERKPGELLRTLNIELEIEGQDKPALVAEWLTLWVTDA